MQRYLCRSVHTHHCWRHRVYQSIHHTGRRGVRLIPVTWLDRVLNAQQHSENVHKCTCACIWFNDGIHANIWLSVRRSNEFWMYMRDDLWTHRVPPTYTNYVHYDSNVNAAVVVSTCIAMTSHYVAASRTRRIRTQPLTSSFLCANIINISKREKLRIQHSKVTHNTYTKS